jgi:hypothetical protein
MHTDPAETGTLRSDVVETQVMDEGVDGLGVGCP